MILCEWCHLTSTHVLVVESVEERELLVAMGFVIGGIEHDQVGRGLEFVHIALLVGTAEPVELAPSDVGPFPSSNADFGRLYERSACYSDELQPSTTSSVWSDRSVIPRAALTDALHAPRTSVVVAL